MIAAIPAAALPNLALNPTDSRPRVNGRTPQTNSEADYYEFLSCGRSCCRNARPRGVGITTRPPSSA